MTHLTERSYLLLLQGTLPPEEARALARHLEEACESCEEFLASRPVADAVDGLADHALAALVPAGARGNDLEFARIERRLRGATAPRRGARQLFPAALAAAVLAAGLAGLFLPRRGPDLQAWDGVKGARPSALPVRLRFAVVTPAVGGPPSIEKGISGQPVAAAASLQFEVEAGRAGHAALVRLGPGGEPEVFWRESVAEGRTVVSAGGRPAAYPLAGLGGAQRFVLLASDEEIDDARIARAAASALAGPGRPEPPDGGTLSFDVIEVLVR